MPDDLAAYADLPELRFDRPSDGVLRITTKGGNKILGSSGAVEITVQLPAGSRVEAKAAARARATFQTAEAKLAAFSSVVDSDTLPNAIVRRK